MNSIEPKSNHNMEPFVSLSILFDFRWGAFAPFGQENFANEENGNDLAYDDGMVCRTSHIAMLYFPVILY